MSTYLEQLAARFTASSHHSFILYGATRDYQLGNNGSCSLVDHLFERLADNRLVVSFCVGTGWKFAQDMDRQEFRQITGIGSNAGDFAGLTSNQDDDDLPLDTASAIGLVDAALRQTNRPILIILDRAELIVANQSYDRMSPGDKAILSMLGALATNRSVESSGNMLILITDNLVDLAESIRLASSRYYAIEIVPPNYDERLAIANLVFPQLISNGVDIQLSFEAFAQATSMLTRYGLMDILLDANAQKTLTKAQVKNVKAQVMSQEYGDVLEALEPLIEGYNAIAGLEPLKQCFAAIVNDMVAGNTADVPAGLLLAGAAGLGKTYFMRAVAGESGLPVINFNVGRLLGSFVGQSERNLERALTAIKSAAPCLVVLDEIETTFPDRNNAGPNGDSGVSSRILKRMLEELSNPSNRGRIVWVGITNFPNKLDAALSRAGRFDLTIAFLPPTSNERGQLLELYARKYFVSLPKSAQVFLDAMNSLVGYTNAEIENVVRKVRQLAKSLGIEDAWIEAPKRVRANTRDVQLMTNLALSAVNDADMLPPEYVEQWRKLTNQDQAANAQQPGALPNKRLF